MSYSAVGFIPAIVEGATFCPGGYVVRAQGGQADCHPHCPPGWIVFREGGDDVCQEPATGPTLEDGCPGAFMMMDNVKNYEYCAAVCPPGWERDSKHGVELCKGPPSGGGVAPTPSTYPPSGAPSPAPSQAAVGFAELPWWAYVASGAVVLGAAAWYVME